MVWDDARTQAHSELLVLLALADWANDDGYCWPTISALAAKARLSERAVQQILGRLTATGRIRRMSGGGRGRANRYQVVSVKNPESEMVNAIHRIQNTESKTPNEIHPLAPRLGLQSAQARNAGEYSDDRSRGHSRRVNLTAERVNLPHPLGVSVGEAKLEAFLIIPLPCRSHLSL